MISLKLITMNAIAQLFVFNTKVLNN